MQTLDMWRTSFSREGYFEVTRGRQDADVPSVFFTTGKRIDFIEYVFDIKKISNTAKYFIKKDVLHSRSTPQMDTVTDTLRQDAETFANGKKTMAQEVAKAPQIAAISETIDLSNIEQYGLIDAYCAQTGLTCIYLHGSLHDAVYQKSQASIGKINALLQAASHKIVLLPTVLHPDNSQMGDSVNHVDAAYQSESTRIYYETVQQYLK